MRVLAILATYNESRVIAQCLEHLRRQGVEAYLVDNQSDDDTCEIARRFLGAGLAGIETVPREGVYRWRRLLRRKEELAASLDADWFLHLDADEIPLPPRSGTTLREALEEVDAAGYNAVEFAEYTFVPTRESPDHDHPAYRETMHWYYPFAPSSVHLVRAWKRQLRVDLVTTGGHLVDFAERRVYPRQFGLRHYLFLSSLHAARKYVGKRYDPDELRDRWHGWRSTLGGDDIRLPRQAELRVARADHDLEPSAARLRHCLEWPARRLDGEPRPVVLAIVDRPDWAHDRKTLHLQRALESEYRLVRRFANEVNAEDIARADLVLLWYWLQFDRLGELAPRLRAVRHKLVVGICSHVELESAWREPGIRFLAEVPAAVFANNRGLVDVFAPLLGRPVVYAPNGVDTRFFEPAPREPGPTLRVGWAGSLRNHGPGHRGVEEVIAPAVAAVPGAELCLAAREERWRHQEEMRAFYRSLDVYVCASRSEGTPNPCLEAAACGLPIVTTRVGNMPELIADGVNGLFVEREPAAVAAALRRLAEDSELRRRLGAAARRAVEGWDWRRRALAFALLFDGLLDP